ncbi:hypothetical protein CDCA_CDCA03G1043 [Cyanidium caldarium]|uniref:Protein kinase domain-containing protein n=1 Tax=Cyanidium caldarium TaxID=2771 RepID=A0AAV9IRY8_CYACA|nr:hypothetical protein CDCA_CDCA03G1043 [Cyanidium caldarium]
MSCTQFAAANGNERLSAPHTSSVDPGTSTEPSVVAVRFSPRASASDASTASSAEHRKSAHSASSSSGASTLSSPALIKALQLDGHSMSPTTPSSSEMPAVSVAAAAAASCHSANLYDEWLASILDTTEWSRPLGAGAVGIVLLPAGDHKVAVKVSIYETGFRTGLFMHPTRSEPTLMKRFARALVATNATPHLPILYGERHHVPLESLHIPEPFWESSSAAQELQQWIRRRRNCDASRCSVLCLERFEGGTLFHALCRDAAPGIDIRAVRELTFQMLYTLCVLLRHEPDFRHNDLSLANVMLRRRLTPDAQRSSLAHTSSDDDGEADDSGELSRFDAHPEPLPMQRYNQYCFEGAVWHLPLRREQPFEAVIADFDFACAGTHVTNAKVDFFERQDTYRCYRIGSQRDPYGDVQMLLSNLREVVQHIVRKRQHRQRQEASPIDPTVLRDEHDALEFFERRVHPHCSNTQDRSLRGRLAPDEGDIDERYAPFHMLLRDPYFDPYRHISARDEQVVHRYAWPVGSSHAPVGVPSTPPPRPTPPTLSSRAAPAAPGTEVSAAPLPPCKSQGA